MRSVCFASIYLDCVKQKPQANRSLQLGLRNLTSTFSDLARTPGDFSRLNRHSPAKHFDYDIRSLRASFLFWSRRRLITSNQCVMCHQGRSGVGKKRAHNQLISAGLCCSPGSSVSPAFTGIKSRSLPFLSFSSSYFSSIFVRVSFHSLLLRPG